MLRRIVELAVPVSCGRRARLRHTVAALGLAAALAPAAIDQAEAQSSEVTQECQQLDSALRSRGDVDLQSARRISDRTLRDKPSCGYVLARALREKGLLAQPDGRQAADEALKGTQDFLLPSAEGYAYFLKEAIRVGMNPDMSGTRWKNSVASNLVTLRNVAPADYPAFEEQMFEGCVRYVRNPFEAAASCTAQEWMPAELRGKIQSAAIQRAKLDEACTFLRQPRLDDVARCKRAFNDARGYGYSDGHFAMYTERVRVAEEQIALADTVAACTFQGGDTAAIESRFDQVMRCDVLLRNKDPNKETIRASRDALSEELRRLEPRLRPSGDLTEVKRICDLRTRLSPFAEFYGARFPDVCPTIPQDVAQTEQTLKSYIERHAVARPQQVSRVRLNLPAFAQKLDEDCLDKLADFRPATDRAARMAKFGGTYVNGCAPVLGSVIQRLAGLRLGELLGARAVPPAPRGQPGTSFLRAEEILSRWTGLATDSIVVPSTAKVLEQEAGLIAEIVNYRAETIERALCQGRPETGLLTWLGVNKPTVQAAIESFQKLTEASSPLGRLLDPAKQTEISAKLAAWRQPGALCQQAPQPTAVSASPPTQAPSGHQTIASQQQPVQPTPAPSNVPVPQPAPRPQSQPTQGGVAISSCSREPSYPTSQCVDEIRGRYNLANSGRTSATPPNLELKHLKPALLQLPHDLRAGLVSAANKHVGDSLMACERFPGAMADISRNLRQLAELFDDLAAHLMLARADTIELSCPRVQGSQRR